MLKPEEIVQLYLRAQNLEQIRRTDEAIELYERAIEARFDAAGPYDRLIAIYLESDRFDDVKRVAEAAIANVRAVDTKKAWYESMRQPISKRGAEF